MYTPAQIWRQVTPKAQLLIALSLAAIVSFSAGLAAGIYGHAIYSPALTASRIVPAVAPAPQALPAIAGSGSAYDGRHYASRAPAHPTVLALPGFGNGSVYDGGHYGDVSSQTVIDPAAQGVMDYLRAHREVLARITRDPAVQSVMDYLQAHGALAVPPLNPNTPISGTGSAYTSR
jgi:hypothetical protein